MCIDAEGNTYNTGLNLQHLDRSKGTQHSISLLFSSGEYVLRSYFTNLTHTKVVVIVSKLKSYNIIEWASFNNGFS